MKKAKIKTGNDNRHKADCGALMKWEDIVGVKTGTIVDVISECEETNIAVVSLPIGGESSCGRTKYRTNQRKLVPRAALDPIDLDNIAENHMPWRIHKTEKLG